MIHDSKKLREYILVNDPVSFAEKAERIPPDRGRANAQRTFSGSLSRIGVGLGRRLLRIRIRGAGPGPLDHPQRPATRPDFARGRRFVRHVRHGRRGHRHRRRPGADRAGDAGCHAPPPSP